MGCCYRGMDVPATRSMMGTVVLQPRTWGLATDDLVWVLDLDNVGDWFFIPERSIKDV